MRDAKLAKRDERAIPGTGAAVDVVSSAVRPIALRVNRQPIRVVFVGGERLLGETLRLLFGRDEDIEIVGHVPRWMRARDISVHWKPDVVLVDFDPSDLDANELIHAMKQERPDCKVILLTASRDSVAICRAVKLGASGYVSKDSGPSDVTKAIRGVHQGEVWVERRLIRDLIAELSTPTAPEPPKPEAGREQVHAATNGDLTRREREILAQLAGGRTNRHIAEVLFISEKTVKTHLNSIFRKLKVSGRLQAVLYAVGHGLCAQ